jgi:hypothetical protein
MDKSGAAAGVTDLTSSNFTTLLGSASSFEFWDGTGTRQQASGSSSLSAGHIKSGVNLFGITGAYPSASYPLPSASSAVDLDSASFDTRLKSNANFEYWNSAGVYQTGSGNADLAEINIRSGVTVFGVTGTLTAAGLLCQHGSQANCEADTLCSWSVVDGCKVEPWNIRIGRTLAGTVGQLKTSCRNRANSALFNADSMPPGNSPDTSGVTLNWWDTIDDFNNSDIFPSSLIAGWSTNTDCDRTVWKDLTADGSCDSTSDDCMIQDRISGLVWSESGPSPNTAPGASDVDWSSAVNSCHALVFGGQSDWRLPTQKELQEAHIHGIRDVGYKGSGPERASGTLENNAAFITDVDRTYWSATTSSIGDEIDSIAWFVSFDTGLVNSYWKGNIARYICVRP